MVDFRPKSSLLSLPWGQEVEPCLQNSWLPASNFYFSEAPCQGQGRCFALAAPLKAKKAAEETARDGTSGWVPTFCRALAELWRMWHFSQRVYSVHLNKQE